LVVESGFKIVKLKETDWMKGKGTAKREKMTQEERMYIPFDKNSIEAIVESEIEAFKNAGITLLISSATPTCSISARVLKIPLVILISGTASSLYYRSGYATFPENYENVFTKLLPTLFKKYIVKWALINNKLLVKDFNKVAKKYNIKTYRTLNDIIEGDYPLLCDDINFLGVKPTEKIPIENFIGPISMGISEKQVDEDVKKHLKRPGRSILFIMGSITGKLFINMLDILNQTDYNIIAVQTKVPSGDLPETKENILLKQFIKSPQIVNKMVDLAIITGGRGTVYNAAYSGKPSIGIPHFIEQQYNIDCLVRNGACIRISKKFFKKEELMRAINTIFDNYDEYLRNAQKLSKKLSGETGVEKAVDRIMDIIEKEGKT
jgi:UDP:flavonoid glycosyltransferase YjiC (YdhE family)